MSRKLFVAVKYPLVWLVLGWLVAIGAIMPAKAVREESPLVPYTKTILDNGLTLIVKEVHAAPIAAVDIWVGVGSRNEAPGEEGLSHFFEHMLFKGTQKRKVGEIGQAIQSVGGYLNAATSLDYTHYYVVVPGDSLPLALEVEADAIMNSCFDSHEIERERQVILEEMNLKQDDPGRRLGWIAYRRVFEGTPYANDVLGTKESLSALKRENFLKYHRQYYVPNNIVVAVVGDVNTTAVIKQVKNLFAEFKPGKVTAEANFEIPKLKEIKRLTEKMRVDQGYFYLGFPGPGRIDADTPALTVLGVIMGGGQSSRLYQDLRESRKLVSSISSGYSPYQQIGMFSFYAESRKLQQTEFETEIIRVVNDIEKNGVTAAELERAKSMLRTEQAFAAETAADLAALIGENEVKGNLEDEVRFEAAVQRVTKEDVQRVVRKYLNPSAFVSVAIQP